jgi:hypothetical protein
MSVLKVRPLDLDRISRMEAAGGAKQWALGLLKVPSLEDLEEFFKWKVMSKVEKIESLIPKMSSPRDFLNLVYTHYIQHKVKNKAQWKKHSAKEHLLRIKQIADACIVRDEMSLKDAQEIAMRSYFAIWAAINAAPEETTKVIPLQINRQLAA